jgi:predicted metal-dependent enzyme (double-stranded beta helix superfamily)
MSIATATRTLTAPAPVRPDLVRTARALARDVGLWRPALRFSRDERVTTRLRADDEHEAWLITWMPGQATEVHDHGGSAGAIAVLSGWLHETVAGEQGQVGAWLGPRSVRAFAPDHVHQVANISDSPAVSLHVYAPRLHTMTRYTVVDGGLAVAGVARAGADW